MAKQAYIIVNPSYAIEMKFSLRATTFEKLPTSFRRQYIFETKFTPDPAYYPSDIPSNTQVHKSLKIAPFTIKTHEHIPKHVYFTFLGSFMHRRGRLLVFLGFIFVIHIFSIFLARFQHGVI